MEETMTRTCKDQSAAEARDSIGVMPASVCIRRAALLVVATLLMWCVTPSSIAAPFFGTDTETLASVHAFNCCGFNQVQIVDCLHNPNSCGDGPRSAKTD